MLRINNSYNITSNKFITKNGKKIEYVSRKIRNKFLDLIPNPNDKKILKKLAKLKPEQNEDYLKNLSEILKYYTSNKIIEINIEDKILEDIAQKGDSAIFIMNHSNQKKDPIMLATLNKLLINAYQNNKSKKFPLSKIIINEDILKTSNPTKRKAFENIGAVGIDASINNRNKEKNAHVLFSVIKDFVKNNCNIFLFPEGISAINKNLDLYSRFQSSAANIVNVALSIKKEVIVVPVGFAYGKLFNSINIGTPITFKRENNNTTTSQGDILKNKKSPLYEFFNANKDKKDIIITKNKIPVPANNITKFIKRILVENLDINSNIAIDKLNTSIEDVKNID